MISAATARQVCAWPLALGFVTITLASCGGSRVGDASPSTAAHKPLLSTNVARSGPNAQKPYDIPVVRHVQARQIDAFPLLRTPAEGLPIATQRILRRPAFGINWNLARRIPTKLSGSYWLVPGDGYLCVVSQGVMHGPGVGTTCAQTAEAIAHGIADISITLPGTPHRARLIVGVAPVGTRQVLVRTEGKLSVAMVHHGVFVLRDLLLLPPDTVTLH
jgi:hypothetical protein